MKQLLLILCGFILLIGCGSKAATPEPIKALIVTGQNNHNWPLSHMMLKEILENSGVFSVDLAISPPKGEDISGFAPDFSAYEVVILDYNGDRWSSQTDDNFLQYINQGGGLIVYHASNNAFPDWEAYNRIIGLGGWGGRNEHSGPYQYWVEGRLIQDESPGGGGSHGLAHTYRMTCRDANHPITRGLPSVWLHNTDELYDRMRGPGKIEALLYTAYSDPSTNGSGREEPLVFTVDYGSARIFHLMIGHVGDSREDSPAMQCAGFQTLLLRGAEWAATGEVNQVIAEDFPTAEEVSIHLEKSR